jgi:hypothetical protein
MELHHNLFTCLHGAVRKTITRTNLPLLFSQSVSSLFIQCTKICCLLLHLKTLRPHIQRLISGRWILYLEHIYLLRHMRRISMPLRRSRLLQNGKHKCKQLFPKLEILCYILSAYKAFECYSIRITFPVLSTQFRTFSNEMAVMYHQC